MTTGMAWRPVSIMVIIKNKVANSVAWRPVSHGVSPKRVFDYSESAKIAKKIFWGNNSVVLVTEAIKTIWNLFIFLRKDTTRAKCTNSTKSTKRKQMIFISLKVFAPAENCCLSYFLFAYFSFLSLFFACACFVSLLLLVSVFVHLFLFF